MGQRRRRDGEAVPGNAVAFGGPVAEVDQLTALGAKGPRRIAFPCRFGAAERTVHRGSIRPGRGGAPGLSDAVVRNAA